MTTDNSFDAARELMQRNGSKIDLIAVFWLYRILLGRCPETLEVADFFLSSFSDLDDAAAYIRLSAEYTDRHKIESQRQYYLPEAAAPFHKSEKRLALAMIVKNEEETIGRMLRSCAPIIDYVVVVDTGSTDRTEEVALRTLANLGLNYKFARVPFENFGQARNAALAEVPGDMDWILMLDADEEIVPQDFGRFTPLLEGPDDIDGWQLPRMNFSEKNKRMPLSPYPDYQKRMFRNRAADPVRFQGHVHETPANVKKWGFAPASRCELGEAGGPHIHHLGYIDMTYEKWETKNKLYSRLGKS